MIGLILLNKMAPILDTSYHLDFLDVGQGDSTLIRAPRSKEVILIDTGGLESFKDNNSDYHVASNTVAYLNSLGIEKVDLLILTHGDADHLGDAMYLMENLFVKSVMINQGDINEKEQAIIDTGKVVNSYTGNLDIRFLNDKDWKDENMNSIVTLLNIKGQNIAIMGDASKEVERYILSNKNVEKIDILKLGHHGSNTSSDRTFLSKMNVQIGIISCGRNNRYKHPSKETINTLDKLDIPYRNTQVDGTISIKVDDSGVTYTRTPP